MKKLVMLAALMSAVAVLDGCSAGGKNPTSSTTTPPPPAAPVASDLLVTVSTPSAGGLADTGAQSATVTATAVDANRNVVASVPVTVVADSTAVVSTSGATTDANGVVTGTIGIGTDKSNRTVTVVVSSGSISKTVTFNVVGATLAATLNPAVVTPGSAGSIQYTLTDAGGTPIADAGVTVSGGLSTTGTTDANGNFTYSYTAPSTAQVLTVSATSDGANVTSTITDSTGSIPAATGTVQTASLAANPAAVAFNPAGSTTNQVSVRALFVGPNNQPIPNIRVRFDLDGDVNGIGGTLTSGTNYVYSDANGVASTTYIPGSRSSGENKLTIRGCWSNNDFDPVTSGAACPNGQQVTQNITVTGASIGIAPVADNLIVALSTSPVVYQISYAVQVTDSAGNPVSGSQVSASVDLPHYYRGHFVDISGTWTLAATPQSCDNEDVNRNGTLDTFSATSTEDANGDGQLEPFAGSVEIVPQTPSTGSGATLVKGSDYTDQFGRAYFYLQYGANYAEWSDYSVTFRATVAGTEGHKATPIELLPFPVAELTQPSMPFMVSPYGSSVGSPKVPVTDPATGITYSLCTASPSS